MATLPMLHVSRPRATEVFVVGSRVLIGVVALAGALGVHGPASADYPAHSIRNRSMTVSSVQGGLNDDTRAASERDLLPALGLGLVALTDDTRKRYGIGDKVGQGVVVVSVDPASPVKARVRVGDVIVGVDEIVPATPIDVERALTAARNRGKSNPPLLIADPQGQVRFVPSAMPAAQSVAIERQPGPSSRLAIPSDLFADEKPQICSGALAAPAVRDAGEDFAKRLAIAIARAPLAAFGSAEEVRQNQQLSVMVQHGTWIVTQTSLYEKFLDALQGWFNDHDLPERQLPLSLHLTLQAQPALGIVFKPLTPETSKALGLRLTSGLLLTSMPDARSPGIVAGLRVGDVLTSIDGVKLAAGSDLINRVIASEPGEIVALEIIRDNQARTFRVTIGARNPAGEFVQTQSTRKDVKAQLTACFPALARTIKSLEDRRDEGRVMEFGRKAAPPISPTSCSEAVDATLLPSATPADRIIALIRSAKVQRLALEAAQETSGGPQDAFERAGSATTGEGRLEGLISTFKERLRPKLNGIGPAGEFLNRITSNMAAAQAIACFPDLTPSLQALTVKLRKDAQIKAEEEDREHAAYDRDQQQRKRSADVARANLPANILATAYNAYMNVKKCYDAREGYQAVYVSDPEMEHARNAVRQIEDVLKLKLLASEPPEQIWDRAAKNFVFDPGPDFTSSAKGVCGQFMSVLLRLQTEQVPGSAVMKKDF